MTVEIKRPDAPPRCEDLCAAAILGGEKGDDLPKDVVWESLMRSAGDSTGSSGPGGVAASGRAAGSKIYIRRRRWPEPHLCTYQSKRKNGRNIHVGHSKSILKIWKKKGTTYM